MALISQCIPHFGTGVERTVAPESNSVLIVGLARNCSHVLESGLETLEAAFEWAKELQFLVIESDSSDGSLGVLQRVAAVKPNFCFVSLGRLRDKHPKRTDRIAQCRNHYVKLIRERPDYHNVDYVVVADMDGVNSELTAAAVLTCWTQHGWDVCAANQSGPYYDIWALRHPLWSPNDCQQQARFLRSNGVGIFRAITTSVYSRMIRIEPSSKWIEVDSAFGGLAIYRKEALESVRYWGLSDQGDEICEHVTAHAQMRSAGRRIFVNPALINAGIVGPARNAVGAGLFRLWFRCQAHEFAHWLGLVPSLKKTNATSKNYEA